MLKITFVFMTQILIPNWCDSHLKTFWQESHINIVVYYWNSSTVVRNGPCPTVCVPPQQTWTWTPRCHLSWSCWTTSPVSVMVCRSEYGGCWLLPLWASAWVSGWTMDMWTFRLWAFSKRLPHIRHANSRSASALCLVMWYFSEARWRHWKPHTSHLRKEWNWKCQV